MATSSNPNHAEPVIGQDTQSSGATLLAELSDRLEVAVSLQGKADIMTAEIAELELAEIETSLKPRERPEGLSPDELIQMGGLLERRDHLRQDVQGFGANAAKPVDENRRLQALVDAEASLTLWLYPPKKDEAKWPALGARILLLIATIAAIWGAITWHWAVLLLLIPVSAPIGLLLNRGDDKTWRRLGAKQRLERTGVDGPVDWEKDAVNARLASVAREVKLLEQRLAEAAMPKLARAQDPEALDASYAELHLELVEVEQQLAARVRRHKLDLDLEDKNSPALAAFTEAARTAGQRARLKELQRDRSRLSSEAAEVRDNIWRALRTQGYLEDNTSASAAALAEAIGLLRSASGTRLH
jgi:hypothetical protein